MAAGTGNWKFLYTQSQSHTCNNNDKKGKGYFVVKMEMLLELGTGNSCKLHTNNVPVI